MQKSTANREEVHQVAEMLAVFQKLPDMERIAILYYRQANIPRHRQAKSPPRIRLLRIRGGFSCHKASSPAKFHVSQDFDAENNASACCFHFEPPSA